MASTSLTAPVESRWANRFSDALAARLPFFYGYVMIPVAMVVQVCTSPGQTFAVSAFKPSLRAALDLSHTQLSLAYMLGTMLAAIPLCAVGPLSDRFGLRKVTLLVTIMLAIACLFASRVSGWLTLLGAFFLLRFLGQGSLSLLSGNTLAMWFRNRIGRVSAVMSVGMAVAFAVVPDLLMRSIEAHGWRTTYQIMAAIVVATTVPVLILLFRNRPEDVGQSVDGIAVPAPRRPSGTGDHGEPTLTFAQAVKGRAFWILAAGMFAWAMIGTAVVLDLVELCRDRGLTQETVAPLFRTFAISMLVLQLAGGVLADWLPLNRLLACGLGLLTAGIAVLAVSQNAWQLHLFSGLFGSGQGLTISVGAVVWVRYYGRQHLGKIRGTVWSLTIAGSGIGPLIMGVSRDMFGRFDYAVLLFVALLAPLTLLSLWATAPTQRTASP